MPVFTVDAEAAKKWLGTGAQPSDRVRFLLTRAEVIPSSSASTGG